MIRPANENDLSQIAQIHHICFPSSLSTKIGRVDLFYKEFMSVFSDLFLVATNENGEVIGFCVGYLMTDNKIGEKFMRNNFIYIIGRTIKLLLMGDKEAWKTIVVKKFRQQKSHITNEEYVGIERSETGDLMSICVLPEYWGTGIAGEMIERFVETLKKWNMKRCILTVEYNNARGIHFYRKHGFAPYREISQKSITFARLL